MKLYCPTCGGGTNYSLEKPRFCASCGEPFTISKSTTPRRISKLHPEDISAKIEKREEEERFELPEVEKLQYDLQTSTHFNITPLDKLAGTDKEGRKDGYVREVDQTYSEESFAKDFMMDAGSSRKADAET